MLKKNERQYNILRTKATSAYVLLKSACDSLVRANAIHEATTAYTKHATRLGVLATPEERKNAKWLDAFTTEEMIRLGRKCLEHAGHCRELFAKIDKLVTKDEAETALAKAKPTKGRKPWRPDREKGKGGK